MNQFVALMQSVAEPELRAAVCLQVMAHPSDLIVGIRMVNEDIRDSLNFFHFGIFDAKTHKCYTYGETAGTHVEQRDNEFYPCPFGDFLRQRCLQTVHPDMRESLEANKARAQQERASRAQLKTSNTASRL